MYSLHSTYYTSYIKLELTRDCLRYISFVTCRLLHFVRFRSISFVSLRAAMCYCRIFRAVSSVDGHSLWKSVM